MKPDCYCLVKTNGLKISWFYAFFFISGFCSLVYEVVWLRLAMAKFGITTPMVSIVLSVFMAGLGIGSWAGGLFIRRFDRSAAVLPLRLYALVELLIGLSGILAPLTINAGAHILTGAGKDLVWNSSTYYLVSGAWIMLALLPWCTCMGATFPFAMAAIRGLSSGESGHSFSYLYLANVMGAVLGTLVPAFFLIELFGFRGTLEIAIAMNGALALAVFLVSLASSSPQTVNREQTAVPARSFGAPQAGSLWMLFATGLCSMAMEVIWIRQFTVYLGNVVYAFAVILAIYLSATFLGSSAYRKWIHSSAATVFSVVWIPLGLTALLPLLFADPRLPLPEAGESAVLGLAWGAVRAALGIGLFSGAIGFLTPMLVDHRSGGDAARAGAAYSINVLGCILGPLVAGFFILPWAGERWGLCLLALPLFAIGFFSAKLHRAAFGGTILAALLLVFVTKDFGSKFPRRIEMRDHTATVIATGEGMSRRLLVNGVGMTKLTPITKMMVHLPLSFRQTPARKGLVICFGMGTSFRSMLSWGIDVTVVELVPSVPKLFGYFHEDGPALLRSPLAHVVIDDGRRFLDRSSEQFDVIAADPPPPIGAPTSSLLYSQEFYAVIKRHLRPNGIVQVWCPGGDTATMSAIAKALRGAFPYIRAYESIEGWGVHFLVSMQPIAAATPAELAHRMPANASKDLVEWDSDSTPEDMFDDVVGDGEQHLDDFIKGDPSVPPIQDDRPINEYFLLRHVF
jgi:spermidine synthase/MFS family permease